MTFLRKTTREDSDRQSATGGFHKSLWNCFRRSGFDASSSGSTAWLLIRAARPSMPHHEASLAQLRAATRAELDDMRAAVNAAMGSAATQGSPARTELAQEILRILADARAPHGSARVAESAWVPGAPEPCPPMTISRVGPGAAAALRVAPPPRDYVNLPFAPGEDSSHGGVSEAESDRRGRIFDRWTAEAKDLGISGQALRVFMTSRAEATFPPAEEDDPVTGVREVTQ